ncbi:MAG: 5-formyltetrahydrofolate cyclo-ligase [Deltaproteobacteria bacterium GWA2_38_16]|nr:MAG: 5-formyltetrahydrofolate cyclo-ligase [Deltaproteobacteria bacterium GWA2_38_16]OGQ02319.1 MAG: 5-formyltetrahydrofolate cyclo-ligase [Deltaproteobacteria bacterium RIFCSPHIGHO2_02_FULL_38_15]OGQ30436.1 MAG: 5-formyltetrahydrofolate cyclo-ligase [Deltaproteobacteria bacterium RIFCSPLOWO2_01_FULL_38_9]OGQ61998.1 MAG: 5-formyltetrahydrofolate cyclo-ligase [Deltaproteobacteria bacterium RIFCSPLOWO2_12_FULL_38_8]HBQ22087.1 5-formyltetrahydrofolate cyclo-ligase [Deltaproteobacteria bacterium
MPNPSSDKQKLRQRFLEERLAYPPLEIKKKSDFVQKRFLKFLKTVSSVKTVALYAECKNEVSTREIFKHLRKKKIRVVYPKINRQKKTMAFCEVKNLKSMKHASYAILEPKPGALSVAVQDIDMVVVPAIVFDEKGHRLGYGKGYYDRLLSDCSSKTVGLAFEFQMVKHLPREQWDRSVHMIITEKKMRTIQ